MFRTTKINQFSTAHWLGRRFKSNITYSSRQVIIIIDKYEMYAFNIYITNKEKIKSVTTNYQIYMLTTYAELVYLCSTRKCDRIFIYNRQHTNNKINYIISSELLAYEIVNAYFRGQI